jgi:hypothetical protein
LGVGHACSLINKCDLGRISLFGFYITEKTADNTQESGFIFSRQVIHLFKIPDHFSIYERSLGFIFRTTIN